MIVSHWFCQPLLLSKNKMPKKVLTNEKNNVLKQCPDDTFTISHALKTFERSRSGTIVLAAAHGFAKSDSTPIGLT